MNPTTPISAVDYAPDRATALARLRAFAPHAGRHYASQRNADYGPADRSNVSALSPAIRHRLILETEVVDAVLDRFALSTSEKFIQEVFWRTYFKGWLEQRPSVWTAYRRDVAALVERCAHEPGLDKAYRSAVAGATGIDCFDAWAHELIETGYLHNHARMWFASIWIFTLRLPWQLGADFFYRHLMDGDPASNTLSWRWVGGLHTAGKTYLARADNIARYTDGRFAPHGQLADLAPPLVETMQHQRSPIPEALAHIPQDDQRTVVLITEEDAFPESMFAKLRPTAAVGIRLTSKRSPLAVGPVVTAYAKGAMQDALTRAGVYFDCETIDLDEPDDPVQALCHIVTRQYGTRIATAYCPVGPSAEFIAQAKPALAHLNKDLVQVRRRVDTCTWPHATRGFFQVKKKIPDILEDLRDDGQLSLSFSAG